MSGARTFPCLQGREWLEFEDATLCEMIADGKTFAEVAAALGRSRGSVIGRFDRIRRYMEGRA